MRNCKSALCCDFTRLHQPPQRFLALAILQADRLSADDDFRLPRPSARHWPPARDGRATENADMAGIPCSLRSCRTARRGARRGAPRSARGRGDQRTGCARHRRAGLPLFLFARHNGPDAEAAHQRRQARGHLRADEHVRQHPGISDGGHEGRGPAELRHAVFQRLARPDQGADDRIRARYAWALLPAADARHVDRRVRVPGLAHDRNAGRRLCRDAAGLERLAAGRRRSHRRADALCLDHRPHQDRRTGRL